MSYDQPQREQYSLPSAAFGATGDSIVVKGPPGKKGLVTDILVSPSADFVGTTTVPEIDVGTAVNDFTYGRFRLGSTATAGYTAASGPQRARSVAGSLPGQNVGSPISGNDYAGHVGLESAYIPADTPFTITRKAGVGGTPAGTGHTTVFVKWF